MPLYEAVNSVIPAGSVVMINLPLTTWWVTYFPHYIVAHVFDFVLTPNIDETRKKNDVQYFYANPLGEASLEILKKYSVSYVFMLAQETAGKGIEKASYLKPVLVNNMFSIYKVEIKE